MDIAVLIVLLILVVIVCGTLIALAWVANETIKYLRHRDASLINNDYKNIDVEKIDKIFNDIVEREFNDYQRFHPDLSQDGSYIKREEIQSIVTDITARVYTHITPAVKYNIGLIYNVDDNEKLVNLIGERVGVLVMGLAAAVNSSMIDDTTVNLEV